jgi:CheY-like chemotaxis protein
MRAALGRLRTAAFDLLVTDLQMPGLGGIKLARDAKQLSPHVKVLIVTGYPSQASAIEAVNLGIDGYVTKPFGAVDLLFAVARMVLPSLVVSWKTSLVPVEKALETCAFSIFRRTELSLALCTMPCSTPTMASSRWATSRSTTSMRTAAFSSTSRTRARALRTSASPASGFNPSSAFKRTPGLESRDTALSKASRTSLEPARLFKRLTDSTRTAGLWSEEFI